MSRTYPSDHKIPEAFLRQLAAKQSAVSSSQGAGIRFSSYSLGGNIPEEQGFAHSDGLHDDFKHFLELHPGMSIEEALHRFRDEQKAKLRRKGQNYTNQKIHRGVQYCISRWNFICANLCFSA